MGFFRRTVLSDRQEKAVKKTLQHLRTQRRNRFRILACIDGSEESYVTVRWAAKLGQRDECDIIILYVRAIDQGLHSGGLQVRLARQNMLDAGFELPGVSHLKKGLDILAEEGIDCRDWPKSGGHDDAWGDAAGDTKVEYRHENGRVVVLKLKTAPDVSSGILDQYELGPYNLMILGEPSHWRGEVAAFFNAGVVQTVSTMAPCSVLVARNSLSQPGVFIHIDGTPRSLQAVRRAAVLANAIGQPVTLFGCAENEDQRDEAERAVREARDLLAAMGLEPAHAHVRVGSSVEEIVEAGSMSGMIVVTDEGYRRLKRMFKGSLAGDIIKRARTSVLDIR
jgi:nucleotide-binding universal stress UspA family protein